MDASHTKFADSKSTYESALSSLFSGKPEDTESDLSKLFTPTFTFQHGQERFDFASFVLHIRHLRELLPKVTLTVTHFLRDGKQLAERHLGRTTRPDGSISESETFQIAEVAPDGRVSCIIELVRSRNS